MPTDSVFWHGFFCCFCGNNLFLIVHLVFWWQVAVIGHSGVIISALCLSGLGIRKLSTGQIPAVVPRAIAGRGSGSPRNHPLTLAITQRSARGIMTLTLAITQRSAREIVTLTLAITQRSVREIVTLTLAITQRSPSAIPGVCLSTARAL